jgi:hypothetical protein
MPGRKWQKLPESGSPEDGKQSTCLSLYPNEIRGFWKRCCAEMPEMPSKTTGIGKIIYQICKEYSKGALQRMVFGRRGGWRGNKALAIPEHPAFYYLPAAFFFVEHECEPIGTISIALKGKGQIRLSAIGRENRDRAFESSNMSACPVNRIEVRPAGIVDMLRICFVEPERKEAVTLKKDIGRILPAEKRFSIYFELLQEGDIFRSGWEGRWRPGSFGGRRRQDVQPAEINRQWLCSLCRTAICLWSAACTLKNDWNLIKLIMYSSLHHFVEIGC